MPTEPTVQPGLLPVPDPDPDVPIIAMDVGADAPALAAFLTEASRAHLRTAALDELRTIGLHPIPAGAYVPGPVAGRGWSAQLTPGRLELRSPTRLVYAGDLAAWPAYTRAVEANGWVLFYAGHIALGLGADAVQAMRRAADRGEVLGGVVPARWTPAT
jgi:hypothetical protein